VLELERELRERDAMLRQAGEREAGLLKRLEEAVALVGLLVHRTKLLQVAVMAAAVRVAEHGLLTHLVLLLITTHVVLMQLLTLAQAVAVVVLTGVTLQK
jgi:hypothetical protein